MEQPEIDIFGARTLHAGGGQRESEISAVINTPPSPLYRSSKLLSAGL